MFRRLVLCWILLLIAACAAIPERGTVSSSQTQTGPRPLTILISIDGFHPSYLDRGVTPVLSGLAAGGVRGAMRPSFPSKTFPNHYTLVTGLRPDRHGVVENTMEDPAIPGVTFRMSNASAVTDARWWDQGEPLWVTAERAGVISATMFWPGSEAAIRGIRPRYLRKFDQSVAPEARVDQVLTWLDLPEAMRPAFITLYFDDVDTAGHLYGPDGAELNRAVGRVDTAVGRLAAGLTARGLLANILVVSDHGMAAMSDERVAYLDDVLPKDAYRSLAGGAFMTIYPRTGREAEVDRALIRPHANFQCWRRSEMPARFHYGRNPRVAPYFCLPETGWRLTTRDFRPARPELGAHGFDPHSPEMAAVFVAHGPDFRRGVVLPTFDNVSVYPLLAQLVGVTPAPNDGQIKDVRGALTR